MDITKKKKRNKDEVIKEIETMNKNFNYSPLKRTDVHNLEEISLILAENKALKEKLSNA